MATGVEDIQAWLERAIMDAIMKAGPLDYTEEGREMVARLAEAAFPSRKFRVAAEPMPDRGVKVTITEVVEVIEISIEV